jgi:hypothetical protein
MAFAAHLSAQTTHNDDSCDIGTYPAATLLLPYFEVDLSATPQATTIFSVTNVSATPQIANVTIWTDWAFPVISFPIFLTGYDVQPINLYDVIARGVIGGVGGTSTNSPNARDSRGQSTNPNLATTPLTNLANPLFLTAVASDCAPGRMPREIPGGYAADVRAQLSTGRSTGAAISCPVLGEGAQLGGNHGGNVAVGYITIDVVATCSPLLHTDPRYWDEILFDNVLTGDYQQIVTVGRGDDAGGNPMVRIRAVPEGGAAGNTTPTALPYTFYDRYTTSAPSRTYSGIVHFTSSDAQAVLPANATLTNGIGPFNATLKTAGTQTITATDTVTASITGTSVPSQYQQAPRLTSRSPLPRQPRPAPHSALPSRHSTSSTIPRRVTSERFTSRAATERRRSPRMPRSRAAPARSRRL